MICCSDSGVTPVLILTVFVTCFGSSFVIGYNLGIMNLPGEVVKNFTSKYIKDAPSPAFMYALVSAVFVVAGAIGSFSSGILAESLGRRNTLLMNNAFSIAGAILTGPCVVAESPALLYVGRIVTGFNAGISMGVASLYLTEVSPRDIRGAVGACHQLAVTIGITVAYILTLDQVLNTETLWPLAVGLGAVPAAISMFVLPICPESPRFLFTNKRNEYEARKAFVKMNSKEDVDMFIGELREEMETAQQQPKFKFSQIFTRRDLRMPILLACLIQVQQQLSGINAVITYSSTMLRTAGLANDKIQYCVVGIGAFNVAVTVISVSLLERTGRRQLLLWPAIVLSLSLLVLTITVTLASQLPDGNGAKTLGIVSAVFIFVYIGAFAIGLGPVPGLIVSELFRQEPRAAAYALSQGIQWLSNLLVLISYPSIDEAIGGYSFLIFFVIVVACWVVFFLFLPETKNRTFDDVAQELAFPHILVGKKTSNIESSGMQVFTKQSNPDGLVHDA
ncbi:Solute carrier family 2 facilitated glucose transporter member 3 [Fasciola hepatica]|uniref:Solute carrier family 2 facilitated glucose transporter member 3 n=1 Tax=Fasciola hepatica TaxID=6192 RepID=A0A4E0R8J4_FASHE|nr:Solute carrier family 2 facilitated glucose transporter member 3 [Fasciola hepatica]